MKKITVALLVIVALALSGCLPGSNELEGVTGITEGEGPAGFWLGLWHGFILVISWIVSLFNDSVNVYEVHNNGGWYNFGFILGIMFWAGGAGGASKRR